MTPGITSLRLGPIFRLTRRPGLPLWRKGVQVRIGGHFAWRNVMVESERRKPDIDVRDAVPIQFGDGQVWYVPKPRIRITPVVSEERVDIAARLTYGDELDALSVVMAEGEDDTTRLAAVVTLAAALLTKLYDLAVEDLERLLSFTDGEWMKRVVEVATGQLG
jgi:hypothetical protein